MSISGRQNSSPTKRKPSLNTFECSFQLTTRLDDACCGVAGQLPGRIFIPIGRDSFPSRGSTYRSLLGPFLLSRMDVSCNEGWDEKHNGK